MDRSSRICQIASLCLALEGIRILLSLNFAQEALVQLIRAA